MSDKRAKKNNPPILYRILQSPCNKSLINLTSIEVTFLYYDVHSIWISEGIVLPNMELLRMFDVARILPNL